MPYPSARVVVDESTLRETCAGLAAGGALLLTVVATDERALPEGGYRLRYVFAGGTAVGGATIDGATIDGATDAASAAGANTLLRARAVTTVECHVDATRPVFPSVALAVPAVHWDEREIHDLFGLEPLGHPDLRPLVLHDDWPVGRYPLRKDFELAHALRVPGREGSAVTPTLDYSRPRVHGEGVMQVPVGPIHAGVIEPGHFRFSAVGERILHLDARLFYTHRGLEKSAEGLPVERVLAIAERLCGVCSAAHTVAYCHAVEELAGIGAAIPPRAQYIRAVALELERLYNHVGDIGNVCAGVGFAAGSMHGARLREALLRLNETVLGHRYLRGVSALGGVRRDLTPRYAEGLARGLYKLQHEFHRFCQLLADADSFQERLLGTGILPRETAAALGAAGVAARASGVDVDLRRDLPYGAYVNHQDELAADPWPAPRRDGLAPWRIGPSTAAVGRRGVPVYADGDVRARAQVRIDETYRSFHLLQALLELLREPGAAGEPLRVPLGPLPAHEPGIGWAESPRGGNVHWLTVDAAGFVSRYHVRSSSFATWPCVALAAPGNMLPDFPLINKSFELCYSCCDR